MIDRIYGLENEYGIIFTSKGRASLPAENAIRYLFEKLIPYEYFLNVFLENGARLYQDTGCHPEYATPECFDPMDLVRYDRAGDRIIEELLNYAEFRSEEEGLKGKLSIFKNNTDFFGNSYGCHENYLVDRYVNFDYMAQKLIPFLVTRQVFAGSGRVVDKCVDGVYCISQRAEHICKTVSGTTTNYRSIINTRDEPLSDRRRYRRLHLIVGDSNISEYTTYLKVGVTGIVLRLIEDYAIDRNLTLRNPVMALRDISYDLTLRRPIQLDDGRRITALEVQNEYLEAAQKYFRDREMDPITADVMEKWARALYWLEHDPYELKTEIDWVVKKHLVETYREKHGLEWNDSRIQMLDLQYHDISRKKGIYYLLERQGKVKRVTKDADVERCKSEPPKNTRAKIRGDFIKFANRYRIPYDLDWSHIRYGNLLDKRIVCEDPFEVVNEGIEQLMASLQNSSLKSSFYLSRRKRFFFSFWPR